MVPELSPSQVARAISGSDMSASAAMGNTKNNERAHLQQQQPQQPFRAPKFPARLHYVLREVEKDGQDDVLSWLPDGLGFCVHDRERLEKEILPK